MTKKSDPSCALEKKGFRIDLTKEEDHTGLRKIYFDRSGPKLNKIQAQLESPTLALSTPEISIVAPKECSAAVDSKVVDNSCMVFVGVPSGANEVGFYGTKSQYFFFVLICMHIQTHCVRAGIDTQVNSWLRSRARIS